MCILICYSILGDREEIRPLEYKPCGYYRVSKEDTHEEKLAVRKYRQQLTKAGVKKDDIYWDFASGSKGDRDNYQKMMSLVKVGIYDLVVTPMQSRLNRNVLNSELLLRDLESAGAKLKILSSGQIIDPSSTSDKMIYRLNAVVDNNKLDEIKNSSKDNAVFKRSRKEVVSNLPFGYKAIRRKPALDKDPYVCLVADKSVYSPADVLRLLIDLVFEHRSCPKAVSELHAKFGVILPARKPKQKPSQFNFNGDALNQYRRNLKFSPRGVKTLLANPLLKGDLAYFWRERDRKTEIYPNEFPEAAILSPKEYDRLNIIKSNPSYGKKQKRYPYTGIIYCSHCQGRYRIGRGQLRKDGTRRLRYYCSNGKKRGCSGKAIYMEQINLAVRAILTERYKEITAYSMPDELDLTQDPEIQQLLNQIAQLETMGENSAIKKAIAESKSEIQKIYQAKTSTQKAKETNTEILEVIFADPKFWESLDSEEEREVTLQLIESIYISSNSKQKYGSVREVNLKV